MNIKHSSKSSEWYTPKWLMDKVHNVIGYPDFDPASNEAQFTESFRDVGVVCNKGEFT